MDKKSWFDRFVVTGEQALGRLAGGERIQPRLIRSHLKITILGLGIMLLTLGGLIWQRTNTQRFTHLKGPMARASKDVFAGVQDSMSALRDYIALGDPAMREARQTAWKEQVKPALADLIHLSKERIYKDSLSPLSGLETLLLNLRSSQDRVEEIAHEPDNEPARAILLKEGEETSKILFSSINALIDLEKFQERRPGEESLLPAMADFRGWITRSWASLERFTQNGQSREEEEYLNYLQLADAKVTEIQGERTSLDADQEKYFRRIELGMSTYAKLGQKILDIRKSPEWNKAHHLLVTRVTPLAKDSRRFLNEFVDEQFRQMKEHGEFVIYISDFCLALSAGLFLFMAGASWILAKKGSRRITRPLEALYEATRELSTGNYKEIPVEREDEIGALTRSFNKMQRILHEADQELERRAHELNLSNQELQHIAQVASEGLQQPLKKITELLENVPGTADLSMEEALGGSQRMEELIDALHAYALVEAGGKEIKACSAGEALQESLTSLESPILEAGATIKQETLPELPADPDQLTQLFQNLIANGIKYRGEEAPRIVIGAARKEDDWIFSVKDNGKGIPKEKQGSIFQVFQDGSGIGLAVCRKIVQRHGGRIWVKSKPGKGSTFFFSLPALARDPASTAS